MNAAEFVAKWRKAGNQTERAIAHQHFLDLCALFDVPPPAAADPEGTSFTFEKGIKKVGGGQGFADVWCKGRFAWEYKKKHKDLDAAFNQLRQYVEALENPPLLVACDIERIVVKTRFNDYPTTTHEITLDTFDRPKNLDILRAVFLEPWRLKPEETTEQITTGAARDFVKVVERLQARNPDPTEVAHSVNKIIFCMFAEDVGVLPGKIFSKVFEDIENRDPRAINHDVKELLAAMAEGGDFWGHKIPHVNGGLFDLRPVPDLRAEEYKAIRSATRRNWSEMDVSIFGTLFERVMDKDQRKRLGAHYTGFKDIETLVNPVLMEPLHRDWHEARDHAESLLFSLHFTPPPNTAPSGDLTASAIGPPASAIRPPEPGRVEAHAAIDAVLARLRATRVLDPACGSGNFLYVALKLMKDLEKEIQTFCRLHGLAVPTLEVGPHQLYGIEKNPYAHDLAQMTVWIGLIQWHRDNGFPIDRRPLLDKLDNIRLMDAILDDSDPDLPREPDWPDADVIIGNPPFLGGKRMRRELGDAAVDRLFALYRDRVRPEADLVCYWFEKARAKIERRKCDRAGLIATQGIRGGASRETIKRIKKSGDVFFAESDRKWVVDGANVHISIIGFDDGGEPVKRLDGQPVDVINSNLSSVEADITTARRLAANAGIGFMGDTKGGSFDLSERTALGMIDAPNPHGKPSSDIIVPWINGMDVTRRRRDMFVIDYGIECPLTAAALYERPFAHLKEQVYPERQKNSRAAYRERWWIHVEPRPAMRSRLAGLSRFIVTANVSKHRLFAWIESPTLPDHQLIAFARSDDYFFGVLHSRPHEVWARAQGTQVRERESGFRYTPTTCFETFPLPEPTAEQSAAIAEAARRLDELRTNKLNPPEWTRTEVLVFPGSTSGPWARFVHDPDARGIGTVRYPRLVPLPEHAPALAKLTLTQLYNDRPAWLDQAHRALDHAVFASYGWPPDLSDDDLLARLLDLNLERSAGA